MNQMTIYLIRHGLTRANIEGLYYGSSELPIEPRGIEELKRLKKLGIYPTDVQKYFVSGMRRTIETINIIYPGVSYEIVSGLRECDLGDFELKTHEELKDNDDYNNWLADQTGELGCPGGETRNEFRDRIVGAFERLYADLEKGGVSTAAIVFHGGPIVKVMQHYTGEERTFDDWQPENGMGYAVHFVREGGSIRIAGYSDIKEEKNE